jgi:hypothetical protein
MVFTKLSTLPKIQKGKLDDAKEQSGNIEGAIRRYHVGNKKIPEE